MTVLKKRLILAALISLEALLCLLILASLAATQLGVSSSARVFYWADTHAQEAIEERFTVDGPASLELDNLRGEVQVIAGEGNEYTIKAVKEVWGQGQEDAQVRLQQLQVAITRSGGRVSVQVIEPPEVHVLSLVNRGSVVSFEIVVPRQSDAQLSTRDGQVVVRGLEGDLEVENRFGPVLIEDVVGGLTVNARDRDVTVVRSGDDRSAVEIHNRFGEVTLREVTASGLQIENRDGDVSLEDVEVGGPLKVEARFSNVELERVAATDVEVLSDNDAISLKDVQASGRLSLEHKFGQITLYNVTAASLRANAQDGTLILDEVTVEREATLETRFNAIDLARVRAQALTIQGHDRDIELDDVQLEGKLDISARHSGVRVSDSTAHEYRIETRDRPIELEGASGLLWLRNSFGDIHVSEAVDVTLDVEARDGEFSFEGQLSDQSGHRVECEVGDVTLRLPSDTALWLDAYTRRGQIDSELPIQVEGAQDRGDEDPDGPDEERLEGAINGGKTKLRIKVRDGNITLETY
jgi:DUF4097 and DUF4098 domain-containing protein YvlB